MASEFKSGFNGVVVDDGASSDDDSVYGGSAAAHPASAVPSAPSYEKLELDLNQDFGSESGGAQEGYFSMVPRAASSALMPFQPKPSAPAPKADDTHQAFGDALVPGVGEGSSAPIPMGIAVDEGFDTEGYAKYLKSMQLVQRRSHENHAEFAANLKHGIPEQTPQLNLRDIPEDQASADFRAQVEAASRELGHAHGGAADANPLADFLGQSRWNGLEQAREFPVFREEALRRHAAGAAAGGGGGAAAADEGWEAVNLDRVAGDYDEIRTMMQVSIREHGKSRGSTYRTPYTKINPGNFIVVANDGGSGNQFQVWGGGTGYFRTAFTASLKQEGGFSENSLAKITPNELSLNTPPDRVVSQHGRFSIVRVLATEYGFCLNLRTNQLQRMLPGRYFVNESEHRYIGKATWMQANYADAIRVAPHRYTNSRRQQVTDPLVQQWADWINIIPVPEGQVAFIRSNGRTHRLDPSPDRPYVLAGPQVAFLNYANANQPLVIANDDSYTRVNLQPNQFVTFRFRGQDLAWFNKAQDPEILKALDSIAPDATDVTVHNLSAGNVVQGNLSVVKISAQQFALIYDEQRRVRIVEGERGLNSFVLRSPAELIDIANKNQPIYPEALAEHRFARVKVPNGSCAAVLNLAKGGQFELYPSLLSDEAYYFDGQTRRFLEVINMNEPETHLDVPGVGRVSIVNLRSDQIGVANLGNGVFFLKPRMEPYIFVPPMRYIRTESAKEALISEGDLHRVVLQPSQRAAISKDGVYQLLEQDKPGQDNCWVFRSGNFEFYGPEDKQHKDYQLGTQHFVRVEPGKVGYYVGNEGLKILEQGSHILDNAKGEYWEGFYPISVDPLEVKDIEVTSKEGIKLHLDVLVTYSIADPLKTITKFGEDHKQLEKYMEDNTKAEMLRLCGGQPAIGNNKFNISGQDSKASGSDAGLSQELEDKIEKDFTNHVEELAQEYGIHVAHMKILNWRPDPAFMDRMKEQALQLQGQQAENSKAVLESEMQRQQAEAANVQAQLALEAQKLASARALLEQKNRSEMQSIAQQAEIHRQQALSVAEAKSQAEIQAAQAEAQARAASASAESKGQIQVAEAQAQGKSSAAKAQAEAQAQEAKANADAKSSEVAAHAKVEVAKSQQEQSKIEAIAQKEVAILRAESSVAARTAETKAEAEAAKAVAGASKDAAELKAEAVTITAKSDVEKAKADAEIQKLEGDTKADAVAKMKEAEFAGIPEADRAKLVALKLMTEAMKVQAQNTKVVQHVSDPERMNQMMGNSQMMQMMQMMQGSGFGGMPMPFGMGMPSQMQSSQLPGSQSQAGGAGMGMAPFMAAMGNGGGAASSASKDGEHKK